MSGGLSRCVSKGGSGVTSAVGGTVHNWGLHDSMSLSL